MILQVYSVKDLAVDAFMPPFYERSDGAALRAFSAAIGDPKHLFARNPGDYVLYHVGMFDDSSGLLQPVIGNPVLVYRGLDIVQSASTELDA